MLQKTNIFFCTLTGQTYSYRKVEQKIPALKDVYSSFMCVVQENFISETSFVISEYIKKWVDELELPTSIAQPQGGVFTIPMDEETMIEIKDQPQELSIFCKFSAAPEKGKEEFYTHMLNGNLLGQGTDGAALGLTEEGNYLTLSYDMEYPVEYNEFRDIIEDFFNVVDFWREEARLHKSGKLFPT